MKRTETDAVIDFVDDILSRASELNDSIFIDNTYVAGTDKQPAPIAVLTSQFGSVHVFPNYSGGKSMAAILLHGKINQMRQEGFTEEQIQEEKIYSGLIEYSPENCLLIGDYLTRDMKLYEN